MISGKEIASVLVELGVTHVVWLPDSTLGTWERALEACPHLRLVRVCREGEAWVIAAGLYLGGSRPLVVMQTTGLFESGDAMRNVLFDLQLPLYAIVGHRSYLLAQSTDTARRFAEPVLGAWGIDYVLVAEPDEAGKFAAHYRACEAAGRPGITLLAEGKG
ncbi:MAG TPA: thiamine pyrophosphate-binding protein [Pirellulales bacterium]|jgi:sulfopyruvate decarboxylase TPP-binding subunit|nr:thiamine pyrophosphate-binding protein [Pirellulales bacterium]